ncbi:MAG: hypothetical protein GWN84_10235 [Gammaproteobacteria bacterium]|nr:hypothetical protein [Gammaproteobacteria bacterium]NIR83245.1 hypothetical protein [Gammaproteobacteria bacterium]NIR91049.1 hypothetical protein [Gammaproteobacteria bacterium]NIU04410.1 hypothetical protein [Gammaproteobacteria bacterium]NIV76365.1 hypothetical protein [Gammaproteobacteria bacterium]
MTSDDLAVGNWYRDPDGQMFEVVALDEEGGTIDIQYEDGTLGQYDMSAAPELEPAEPQEDWTAVYEVLDQDELDIEPDDEFLHPEEEDWPDSSEGE